jgi:hypothetical protein
MPQLHERFLIEIASERRRLSRRGMLVGSAKIAGGGALALGLAGAPGILRFAAAQELESDVDVLNYALTLEHLENAFYRDGLAAVGDLGTDGFGFSISEQLATVGAHEAGHVAALTDTIVALGGTPVEEQTYNFDDAFADADAFLATSAALENTGVSAYDGAAQFISDPALLTTAGGIVSVEARHAAYVNLVIDEVPFPSAFETPLTQDEVLEIAGPFIAS